MFGAPPPGQYGSGFGPCYGSNGMAGPRAQPYAAKMPYGGVLKSTQMPRRLNVVAMVISLFVPWLIFCLVAADLCFELRYDHSSVAYLLVAVAIVVVALLGALAVKSFMRQRMGDPSYQGTWYMFLFVTSLIALIGGILVGNTNFFTNMQAYYDYGHLGRYLSVNPTSMRGQELMDGGRVFFVNGAQLDKSKATSFKNDHMYCVAPITVGNAPLGAYDFWAVGKDCCNDASNTFKCGDWNTTKANSGLRAVSDADRPFYRLAVQQAEGAFNIKAIHPLFYHWSVDADASMQEYSARGYKVYTIAMIAFFLFQLLLVYLAANVFAQTDKFYYMPDQTGVPPAYHQTAHQMGYQTPGFQNQG